MQRTADLTMPFRPPTANPILANYRKAINSMLPAEKTAKEIKIRESKGKQFVYEQCRSMKISETFESAALDFHKRIMFGRTHQRCLPAVFHVRMT